MSKRYPTTRGEPRAPETQRASRILEIISKISAAPNQWTRRSLAEHYEISERQITKDLQVIRHGLRLELERQPSGGYYFKTLPRLPAVSYSLAEALAIFLAAQAGRRLAGIPHEELSAAIARLRSIMPRELQPLLQDDGAAVPPVPRNRHRERILEVLTRAIAARKSVDLVYHPASRPGERTQRRVDPYAVVPNGQSWHLIGWCHLRCAVRIFKVDRVEDVTVTDIRFTPDPEFDLNEFLTAGWGVTRGTDQPPEEIVLRFTPTAGRWVAEEQWHPTQRSEWLPDGSLEFRVTVPVTEEFARWVLHYGADCDVVAPVHLRTWLAEQARALVERYSRVNVEVGDLLVTSFQPRKEV
ncbi:WYL domain-containing protein [Sphaerobacter thermophilus]|uniref:helix-turn-helix transcriptional regulator n=1 Tax=Sphaerobacter thermophilus TaxID=2057 RepID=UPI002353FD57